MIEQQYRTIMMKPQDNVVVALDEIPQGAAITVVCKEQEFHITLEQNIEFGHKFAVKPIHCDDDIIKYGEVIGIAVKNIEPGEHVHVHNLEGKRGRGDKNTKSE